MSKSKNKKLKIDNKKKEKDNFEDFDNVVDEIDDDDALLFPDVPEFESDDYAEGDPYATKIYNTLKTLAKMHQEMTGKNPTFKDVMDTIILVEPEAGELLLSRPSGIGIAVQEWKRLNKEYGEVETKPFDKGELQQVYNTLQAKVKELGSREKAIESYKKDVAEDKSYIVENPGAEKKNSIDEAKIAKKIAEDEFEILSQMENDDSTEMGQAPIVGLLGLGYYMDKDEDGDPIKVTTDSTKRKFGTTSGFLQVDPTPLLDPDVTEDEEHSLEVEVIEESLWNKVPMVEKRNKDGKIKTVNFKQWVEAREKDNPNFRNTLEFKKMAPIYLKKNGQRVARIHDSEWFNGFSIKSPGETNVSKAEYYKDPEWKEVVEKAEQRNLQLRLKLLNPENNIKTITYQNNQSPKWTRISSNESAMPFSLADPNAIMLPLADATETNIKETMKDLYGDDSFKKGNKIIINSEQDLAKIRSSGKSRGHTYALRRVGSRKIDGKKVETYYLDRVLRKNNNLEQEFESIKSLFQNKQRLEQLKNKKELTEKEKSELEALERFEEEVSKYNNTSLQDYVSSLYKLNKESLDQINKDKKRKKRRSILEKIAENPKFPSDEERKEANRRADEAISDNRSTDEFTYELALEKVFDSKDPIKTFQTMFVQNTNFSAVRQNRKKRKREKGFPFISGTEIIRTVDYADYLGEILSTNFVSNPTRKDGTGHTIVAQPVLEINDSFPNATIDKETVEETNREEQSKTIKYDNTEEITKNDLDYFLKKYKFEK